MIGLVAVGGAVWAAIAFLSTGPQPAEALPDSTIGYVSIDLDPSGSQKIEALKTLRKFPAFKDEVGLNTDDDVRQRLFEEVQGEVGCEGLDYGDDIEPWLGDRMAVAAVDTGEDEPVPVFVLQIKDSDKAEAGLTKVQECSSGDGGEATGGWSINGDWVVIAETDEIASDVADDAASSSLADDEDFQHWTGEAGDTGILTAYVAPEAGAFISDAIGNFGPSFGLGDEPVGTMPDGVSDALKDFGGLALTVRFDEGSLEVETAGDTGVAKALYASDNADEMISTLPDDTAAAIGVGFEDGWFSDLVDTIASYSGGDMSAEELLGQMSDESGLDLPADAETLAGDSAALALGSDFDPETFDTSSDGTDVPVAVKISGDPDAIETVLEKIRAQNGTGFRVTDSDSEGDVIVVGPNADYRAEVLKDGHLGDSDVFRDVVREAAKASAIFFVNFDAGGGWLSNLAGDDAQIEENLEPLSGLGLTTWEDDGVAHTVLRITTN